MEFSQAIKQRLGVDENSESQQSTQYRWEEALITLIIFFPFHISPGSDTLGGPRDPPSTQEVKSGLSSLLLQTGQHKIR